MGNWLCDLVVLFACALILATAVTALALWRRTGWGERLGAAVLAALSIAFILVLAQNFSLTPP